MNKVLKGLLSTNVVEILYMPTGRLPSIGLFTRNSKFIQGSSFNEDVSGKFYFEAFEILRQRKIGIKLEEEILETKVYNPNNRSAMDLYSSKKEEDIDIVRKGISEFKSSYLAPLCEFGDPFSLSLQDKKVIIDLHLGTGAQDFSIDDANAHIEDLNFTLPSYRLMSYIRYGFFFAMDYDWKTEKAAMLFAVKKWYSLVSVYKNLALQGSPSLGLKESLDAILFPDPNSFVNYHQIIDYWPYALSPRPIGLLKCSQMNIQEEEQSPSM